MTDSEEDVPYGEDFHDPVVAAAWAEAVMRNRPWRSTIFEHFVSIVSAAPVARARILELGSGPGFLAEQLLTRCPNISRYTLLDFSEAMLEQSRRRLEAHRERTELLRADFKSDTWPRLVAGPIDFVVSLQAVHELRHKRHAARLYAQLAPLLTPTGEVLICDHLPAGAHTPRHTVLYMDRDEKLDALTGAGLVNARVVWSDHNMAFYRAQASSPATRSAGWVK
jgi:SAM-dependent methyltransferase